MNPYLRIEQLMRAHSMNKADLSRACSISTGNLSDWSSGRASPSLEVLIRIADHFGVSLDYLCGRDDRFPDPDPSVYELSRVFSDLDAEGKKVVLGTAYLQRQRCLGQLPDQK